MSEADNADLSDGWCLASIREVFDLNPPKPRVDECDGNTEVTFVPMPALDADAGAITNPSVRRFAEVRKGFTSFRDQDVIVAKITPCFENGKAAVCRELLNGLGFGSTEFHVLRSTGSVIPEFVYQFVRQESLRRDGAENMTGSVGQKRVPAEWLGNVVLPIPPLAEQRRIVAKVEELLARVNAARERLGKVPKILKRFRQSILAAACSGQLTADWRERYQQISSARQLLEQIAAEHKTDIVSLESGHEAPETWCRTTFGFLASPSLRGGPFVTSGSRGWASYVSKDGPFFVRSENINSEYLRLDDAIHVQPPEGTETDRSRVRGADLLLTITGNNVGRTAVVPDSCPQAHVSQHVAIIRFNKQCFTPYFWLWVRSTQHGQRQLGNSFYGETKPGLNLGQIKDLYVDVPPLNEQREIVRRVESLFALADKIESRVQAATSRVEKITQAILAKAFRGELVPTEAELASQVGREYEPATALLERIRAERATVPAAKAPGRRKRVADTPLAPARLVRNTQLHYMQVAKVICLLLDAWGKPAVSISALEPALAFAFQPDLKIKSRRGLARKAEAAGKTPVAGLDLLYQRMEQRGIIKRVGQHGYALVDHSSIANATTVERDNARQAIERLTTLIQKHNFDEEQARSAVAAAVETPYEVSSV